MSSFWDEFKDLFKSDRQKAEEKNEKINQALDAEKEIVEQLKELDDEYKSSLPKEEEYDLDALFPVDSGLKEIEYTPRSDSDIENSAKQSVAYDKSNATSVLQDKFDDARRALEEGKDKANENLQSSYANLAKLYEQLKEQAQDQSIKRGMGRSSVITSQLNDLSKAHLQSASDQEVAYQRVVASIDANIQKLERDRESALEQLDIKYAIELDERIQKLKDERDKTVKEYEKYNNSIREKNNKYAQDRENDIAKFLKDKEKERKQKEEEQLAYEKKYGYSGEKLENYAKRYDIAFDFYTSLSPDIAVAALEASPNMKYYLGEFYNKLLNVLKDAENAMTSTRYY